MTLRRIGAVLAGLVAIVVLSTATDLALHASGIFPPFGQPMSSALFALALAYRVVYGVGGGWLTARLAPVRPMWHALALGVIGVAVGTVGAALTWNAGPEFGPRWYPLAVIATAIPCTWFGAKLCERNKA